MNSPRAVLAKMQTMPIANGVCKDGNTARIFLNHPLPITDYHECVLIGVRGQTQISTDSSGHESFLVIHTSAETTITLRPARTTRADDLATPSVNGRR